MVDFLLYVSRTAEASGRAERRVECEKCRAVFRYELARTATAERVAICLIWIVALQERADAAARDKLDRALTEESDPVPCPACGWVQAHMNADECQRRYGWLRWAPFHYTVYSLGLALLLFVTGWTLLVDGIKRPGIWLLSPLYIPALLFVLCYRQQLRRARAFDLNAMVPERRRIVQGRQRTILDQDRPDRIDPQPWRQIRRANGGGSEESRE